MTNENVTKEQLAFMQDLAGQGFDGMTAGDFPVPFIKILTNGSPETIEGKSVYMEGAKPGMFLNTATRKLYKTLEVIPLKYEMIWTEWKPRDAGGGFQGRHTPFAVPVIGDPYSGMKTKEGNDIVDHYMFYCLVIGELSKGPVILSLKGAGVKHAKNWNQKIRDLTIPDCVDEAGNPLPAPFFAGVWELSLHFNENDKGSWWSLGQGKETSGIKFVRYINQNDYEAYVGKERKRIDTQKPMLSIEDLRQSSDEDVAEATVVTEEKDF